jgi:hypothetical protein
VEIFVSNSHLNEVLTKLNKYFEMIFFHEILIIMRLLFLGLFYLFDLITKNFLIPTILLQKSIKNDIVLITGAGMCNLNIIFSEHSSSYPS